MREELYLTDEPDTEKMLELLGEAEREKLSTRDLRTRVQKYKEWLVVVEI